MRLACVARCVSVRRGVGSIIAIDDYIEINGGIQQATHHGTRIATSQHFQGMKVHILISPSVPTKGDLPGQNN